MNFDNFTDAELIKVTALLIEQAKEKQEQEKQTGEEFFASKHLFEAAESFHAETQRRINAYLAKYR